MEILLWLKIIFRFTSLESFLRFIVPCDVNMFFLSYQRLKEKAADSNLLPHYNTTDFNVLVKSYHTKRNYVYTLCVISYDLMSIISVTTLSVQIIL